MLKDILQIQEERVRRVVRKVDTVGVQLRKMYMHELRVRRRVYNVPAPLSLWHIDGNHKLTR